MADTSSFDSAQDEVVDARSAQLWLDGPDVRPGFIHLDKYRTPRSGKKQACLLDRVTHSHSIVAGGLEDMS